MARGRGRVRTRYRTITKRARARHPRAFGIGGKLKPAICGGICSAGSNIASQWLGEWAQPLVCGGVGYLMNDKTSMWFAGYTAGAMFTNGAGASIGGGVR